ncbi:MAG: OmpH family outer membrane protein [Pseudomonadota bacterium]
MNHNKWVVLLLSLFLMWVSAPTWANGKYAVFNSQQAILESNTAKSRIKILHKSKAFLKKKNRFDSLSKTGKSLIDKVKKDADVLSLAKKKKIRGDLEGKQSEMAKLGKELEKMELDVRKKLMVDMRPRLQRAVKQVVKVKKIDLLFDRQMVVHASPKMDVTKDVIKYLNQ